MASQFNRLFSSQGRRLFDSRLLFWAFPAAVGGTWFIFPILDLDFRMKLGLASDPEADVIKVQDAYKKRLEEFQAKKAKPVLKAVVKDDEDEDETADEEPSSEEEEEESAPAEETEEEEATPAKEEEEEPVPAKEEEEEAAPADEEEEAEEEESDDDDEEEEEIPMKPLYEPVKDGTKFDMWDTVNIKAVMFNDEDDDDEDEDDDEE